MAPLEFDGRPGNRPDTAGMAVLDNFLFGGFGQFSEKTPKMGISIEKSRFGQIMIGEWPTYAKMATK